MEKGEEEEGSCNMVLVRKSVISMTMQVSLVPTPHGRMTRAKSSNERDFYK